MYICGAALRDHYIYSVAYFLTQFLILILFLYLTGKTLSSRCNVRGVFFFFFNYSV